MKAPFHYARRMGVINGDCQLTVGGKWFISSTEYGKLEDELGGEAQVNNAVTTLAAVHLLRSASNVDILPEAVHEGFAHVTRLTGLMGRWQTLQTKPTVIVDTGHNVGGWKHIAEHLNILRPYFGQLHMIVGMMADKDIDGVMALMPTDASYYFTQASTPRAMPVGEFAAKATRHGLSGSAYKTVGEAIDETLSRAKENDLVFIGGSTFVVADAFLKFGI